MFSSLDAMSSRMRVRAAGPSFFNASCTSRCALLNPPGFRLPPTIRPSASRSTAFGVSGSLMVPILPPSTQLCPSHRPHGAQRHPRLIALAPQLAHAAVADGAVVGVRDGLAHVLDHLQQVAAVWALHVWVARLKFFGARLRDGEHE